MMSTAAVIPCTATVPFICGSDRRRYRYPPAIATATTTTRAATPLRSRFGQLDLIAMDISRDGILPRGHADADRRELGVREDAVHRPFRAEVRVRHPHWHEF